MLSAVVSTSLCVMGGTRAQGDSSPLSPGFRFTHHKFMGPSVFLFISFNFVD